jgi:hypothetical protein
MTPNAQHLTVKVFKENDYWVALPIGTPGSMSGDTLPELFADVEFAKHFCLGVSLKTPVCVRYVPGQPEIAAELCEGQRAFQSLPVHFRPQVGRCDPFDNDDPLNASAAPLVNR